MSRPRAQDVRACHPVSRRYDCAQPAAASIARSSTALRQAESRRRNSCPRRVSSPASPASPRTFPGWYNDVVLKAELADYSPVRGCMIIRPYGYAIWESMQAELDGHIKATGHSNVYFPLFVPKSLLEKEAAHVEGFNPQVAWVTHAGGKALDEWLAIRPTSEAIIADSVKDWIQSYRDLPLLMNIWNNVVRWELRTRLFLRTTEFLWQEAHTFHATEQEAAERGRDRPRVLPTRCPRTGWRSRSSRVARPTARSSPAPTATWCIEAMMRDKKALQAGTSHMLGQNFARAAGIEFLDRDNIRKHPYGTSWGFSTRMVGATIMTHGDDSGLVLPPNVAPVQVVIVPDLPQGRGEGRGRRGDRSASRRRWPTRPKARPSGSRWTGATTRPGFKYNHWELRGVPFRLEIGPRDVAAGQGDARQARRSLEGGRAARRSWRPNCRLGCAPTRPSCSSARGRLPRRQHPPTSTPTSSSRTGWTAKAASSWRRGAATRSARSRSTTRPAPRSAASRSTLRTRPAMHRLRRPVGAARPVRRAY